MRKKKVPLAITVAQPATLRELREMSGLSRKQVALRMKVTKKTVRRMEQAADLRIIDLMRYGRALALKMQLKITPKENFIDLSPGVQ